ncbi:MAG: S-layer homology domain-containing protein [Bacillota bacterium]
MRKLLIISLVFLFLISAGVALAFAQPLDRGALLGVFPEPSTPGDQVTRGAFAAMLVKAANLPAVDRQVYQAKDVDPASWFAPAMVTLKEKGIIAGYPDGTLRPNQPLTGVEAAALTARTLGLFKVPGEPQAGPLAAGHWGSSLYNWLVNQGLVSERSNPEDVLTVDEAADFLARVFGSDPQAVDIVEKSQKAQAALKAMRCTVNLEMMMQPRAAMAGKLPQMKGSGKISMEMVLPATMHQVARWRFTAAGTEQQIPEVEVEQYLVDGKMYMKVTDPATGKAEWMRLPEGAVPDLEALLKQNLEAQIGIPEELRPYLHYQLLGTAEKNGRQVHELGYYGRIDDLTAFFKAALPEALRGSLGGPEFEQSLTQAGKLIKSISFWGREEIGADNFLPRAGEMKAVVSFNDRFQEEAMPVELMEMYIRVQDYSYGDQIKITLPPEALRAEEMPGPQEGPAGK